MKCTQNAELISFIQGSKLGVVVSGSVVDHGVDPVITGK